MKTGMELLMQDGKTIGEILEMKNAEISRLLEENKALREALEKACDQIEYLQYLSGTDKLGPLDALRDGRAALAKAKR